MRTSDASSLRRVFLRSLKPPPRVSISGWADTYRELSSSASAEAGRWRTSRVPYMREVMDVFSPDHPAQEIVLQKGARLSGTESAINNVVGAYMHTTPCPIMIAQPTEGDAEEWSKDSLDPMISDCAVLRPLVTPDAQRKKGNTILHKRYLGGVVYVVGASTAKSFRRRTARVALGDEIDGWPGALAGEGDPVQLMANRTRTYTYNKKVGLISTPTIKGASRIETAFGQSDQRYYHVPCPECRQLQRLVWSQIHWSEETGPDGAEYVCIHCAAHIPHHKKTWMISEANGARWIATRPERIIVGFQVSALYSPWVTWAQLAHEFLKAQGDPLQEQVFTNTSLGETWDLAGSETWDEDGLMRLVAPLPVLPVHAIVMTAGVDVQDDRLVAQLDAWSSQGERWTLRRFDLHGDPAGNDVWGELERALVQGYPRADGIQLQVRAACIDYGGHHSEAVSRFCRRNRRRRWWAIVGRSGPGKRVWPAKPNRKNKGRIDLYAVGVDGAKELLMSRLRRSVDALGRNERGGPGFWHFAAGPWATAGYFDELTAEVATLEYPRTKAGAPKVAISRKWIRRPGRERNEALDCSVYSYAALQGLLVAGAIVELTDQVPEDRISARRPNDTRRAENTISSVEGTAAPRAPPPNPPPAPPSGPAGRKIAKRYM